jgi:hypothetical protein
LPHFFIIGKATPVRSSPEGHRNQKDDIVMFSLFK